jgi:hypothetical protein
MIYIRSINLQIEAVLGSNEIVSVCFIFDSEIRLQAGDTWLGCVQSPSPFFGYRSL